MSARTSLCAECMLLPRRMSPHASLRVMDISAADGLGLLRCGTCAARWRLEEIGDGSEWVLARRPP